MKQTSGFSVIEVLVVVAVVAMVGVGLWWNSGGSEGLRQQFGSATDPVPTPDAREGWLSYRSELDGAAFSYPSDWVLSGGVMPNEDWPMEQVELTSPGGLKIRFAVPLDGLGGACDEASIDCLVRVQGIDPLPEPVNGRKMQVVQYWRTQDNGQTPVYSMYVVDESYLPESEEFYGLYYSLFTAKMSNNYFGDLRQGVASFGLSQEMEGVEVADFYNQAEVKVAELILKSLRY